MLTALERSFAVSRSSGFIFQLPAMNGTRAIIWKDEADERSCVAALLSTPAPWKGLTKALPVDNPATTKSEVSCIVRERK